MVKVNDTKIVCEFGSKIFRRGLNIHKRMKKHLTFMENLNGIKINCI
jgi:hypothetical protein